MSVVVSLRAIQLLGLVFVFACGARVTPDRASGPPAVQPAAADEGCHPTFQAITDKPIDVWSGSWRLGFEAFLVGCRVELEQITAEDRQLIAHRLQAEVKEEGLAFFGNHQAEALRSRLVADFNADLGKPLLSDILIVARYSIEHEPGSNGNVSIEPLVDPSPSGPT